MTVYQFYIIILAGVPAIICLVFLLCYLYCYIEERVYSKRCERDFKNSSYFYMCGDYVDSKKCDEHCDYCKYNNSNLHKRK